MAIFTRLTLLYYLTNPSLNILNENRYHLFLLILFFCDCFIFSKYVKVAPVIGE